jgi:chaperonin GroEL
LRQHTCGVPVVPDGRQFRAKDPNFGYNASTNEYEDLVKAGVIDPTRVTRTPCSTQPIAGLMLTTEAMVSEIPEPRQAAPAGGHGGGMGDMY